MYTFPANRMRWPTRETVEVVARHSKTVTRVPPFVSVIGDNPFFSDVVLNYEAKLQRVWIEFGSKLRPAADFVVTTVAPDRKWGPLDKRDPGLEHRLERRELPYVEIARFSLTGADHIRIYQRVTSSTPD